MKLQLCKVCVFSHMSTFLCFKTKLIFFKESPAERQARRQAYIDLQNVREKPIKQKWYKSMGRTKSRGIFPITKLPRKRVRMTCPNCQEFIRTRLEYHVSSPNKLVLRKKRLFLYP